MFLQGHPAKVKALTARNHRGWKPVRLRCSQNKHHMWRRLFQRLKQRIERFRRQHVNLIYDIHLVPDLCWRIFHLFTEVPYLFNPPVGGRIYLEHIHYGSRRNASAGFTFITRLGCRSILTVHGLG
ncbi:hypothetical protein D3C85_1110550 [compost metagenome]